MEATVPVPEGSSEESQQARPEPAPRSEADQSEASSGDPWARTDPWSEGRRPVRAPVMEEEFMQYLQWRQATQNQTYGFGLHPGLQGGSGQGLWQVARDEHERTTAGPPPEWDGTSIEFKDYKLKARIWLRTTRTPAHARGPLLLKNLTKGPWEDLKFLANDEAWMSDPDNGNKLINLMDSREFYGEEKRESMLSACARLTYHLKRQKGESSRAFMTRWDTAERKIREHDVRLPQEYLGFLMVNALQLDSEKTKLLLNFTKGSLQVADVKDWLRIHETDLDMSNLGNDRKKSTVNYLTDPDAAKEIQLMDIPEESDADENDLTEILLTTIADLEEPNENHEDQITLTESETKEILMTMVKDHRHHKGRTFAGAQKAKKNRDLARGFGAGRDGALRPGTYEVSITELKKRTRCNSCGVVGHWARECPSKAKRGSDSGPKSDNYKNRSKEVNFLAQEDGGFAECEFFYLEADETDGSKGSVVNQPEMATASRDYMILEVASLRPVEQPTAQILKMHGPRAKRGRSTEELHPGILQAWVRMTLRALMVISRAIQHRVQHHLRIPGPRGVLGRQIMEMSELLETGQLDRLVTQLSQALQDRSIREASSRSPTPSEWSRVTSVKYAPGHRSSTSRQAPTTPRSMPSTPTEKMPPTPDRRLASMWEIPADLDLHREAPRCHCNTEAMLWISKTEANPDRLFWKCAKERRQQCSFFQWLTYQPLCPDLTKNSNLEYFTRRQQDLCQHRRTTTQGSNGLRAKEKCLDCGKMLKDEDTPAGLLLKKNDPKTQAHPLAQSSQESQAQLQQENREFQEFLMWRRANEAQQNKTGSRSSRDGLFM
eukprot:s916_g11.t1